MANECLVTKLKGTVDNDNLLKLGEMRVSLHIADDFPDARPCIFTTEPTEVRILGGGVFTDTGLPTKTTSGNPLTIDPYTFPKGSYDIAFNKYNSILNFRLVDNPGNGGMLLANHRGDVIVFNVEDLQYSKPLGLYMTYQQIYGNLHKLVEAGVDIIDLVRLSDCYSLQGTITDVFMLTKGCIEDKYPGRPNAAIEIKQRTSLTGTLKQALDALAPTAAQGHYITISGFENSGFEEVFPDIPVGSEARVTFDGEGGYTAGPISD